MSEEPMRIAGRSPRFWLIAIVVAWVAVGFSPFSVWLASGNPDRAGTFGDSFGVVNSFLSAAALFGVLYTIMLQSRELQLQREELAATKEELARSAEAQEQSMQALNVSAYLNVLGTYANSRIEQVASMQPREGMLQKHELAWILDTIATHVQDLAQKNENSLPVPDLTRVATSNVDRVGLSLELAMLSDKTRKHDDILRLTSEARIELERLATRLNASEQEIPRDARRKINEICKSIKALEQRIGDSRRSGSDNYDQLFQAALDIARSMQRGQNGERKEP